jgi:UDP-N-acetylmuramoylalanine--D-glutamate ligase
VPDWRGLPVVVAGAGVSGAVAARVLRDLGARVTVADASQERAEPLRAEGLVVADLADPPAGTALVVTSPGWRPTSPLLVAAAAAGLDVWGEVELAWRLRSRTGSPAPWLALTGTNGKTTAVRMLESVLTAAGHRAVAAGNVGLPLLEAVLAPESYDVLAVELSSFQLHWSSTMRPAAAAVLNVADDHTDWHGSFEAYARDKARIWSGGTAVGNADDAVTSSLLAQAPGRHVAFTLQAPRVDELGVVEDLLVDRGFPDVAGEATVLAELSDVPVPGDHNVANALAAAALARAHGVPPDAVRDGLRAFRPDAHLVRREPGGVRAGGLDRRRSAEGRRRRRPRAPGRGPAARRGAARDRPATAGGGAVATRGRCPRRRGRAPRHWGHGRRRRARPRPGAAGGHRAARSGRRVHGLLPRLPRARRPVRRRGPAGGAGGRAVVTAT